MDPVRLAEIEEFFSNSVPESLDQSKALVMVEELIAEVKRLTTPKDPGVKVRKQPAKKGKWCEFKRHRTICVLEREHLQVTHKMVPYIVPPGKEFIELSYPQVEALQRLGYELEDEDGVVYGPRSSE